MSKKHPPAVPEHLRDLYIRNGYVRTGRHGDQIADEAALRDRLTGLLLERVVHEVDQLDDLALTQTELHDLLFADRDNDQLRDELSRRLWGLTQAGARGHVQLRLGEMGLPMLLCRDRIRRGERTEQAAYITDNQDLIFKSLQHELEKMVSYAQTMGDDLGWLLEHHPELADAVTERTTKAIRKIYATFDIAYPGDTPQPA